MDEINVNFMILAAQGIGNDILAVDVPPARCDWVPLISPISNYIIGNLRGFGPWFAILAVIGLALALLVAAPAQGPRRVIMSGLGWILIVGILIGAIIGIVPSLIGSAC